jgi:hypothetical protein
LSLRVGEAFHANASKMTIPAGVWERISCQASTLPLHTSSLPYFAPHYLMTDQYPQSLASLLMQCIGKIIK